MLAKIHCNCPSEQKRPSRLVFEADRACQKALTHFSFLLFWEQIQVGLVGNRRGDMGGPGINALMTQIVDSDKLSLLSTQCHDDLVVFGLQQPWPEYSRAAFFHQYLL